MRVGDTDENRSDSFKVKVVSHLRREDESTIGHVLEVQKEAD